MFKRVCLIAFVVSLYVEPAFGADNEEQKESLEPRSQLVELPGVTVSADPLNPSLLEYGKPVSVMDEEQIESGLQSTLGETIRLAPGVRSSFFGQGASRPVIRGFGGDRVRVLKNGVSTGDVSDISEDHVVVADPMQAEQIEILRGPETLLYGSGAIGGAVNVTDSSIPESPLGKPFEGKVMGAAGNSADDERTLGARLKGESGKFNWYASGFSRKTDDYRIPGSAESERYQAREEQEHGEQDHHDDGEHHESEDTSDTRSLDNSDTQSWGATAGGSYIWDKGFFGISTSGFDSEYGVPGHVHVEEEHDEEEHDEEEHDDEEHEDEDVRIDARQRRFDARGRIDDVSDDIESIKYRFGYADYTHDEIEGGSASTTYERDTLDSRVEILHKLAPWLRGAAGLQLMYDDFSATGAETFLTPVKTWSPALFFFEQAAIGTGLDFRFGGRIESVSHNPIDGANREFVPFSLSAGPVWDPTGDGEYNVGLSFAYTERAPKAVELYSNGQHLARQIYEVGKSDLDNEASWGVDLVVRKNRGVLTGAFTPFYQSFYNYINLAGSDERVEGLPVYTYEDIEAYFWGFEFESALHFDELFSMGNHLFSLEYQADYVRARSRGIDGNIPRIPPLRNIVRARYGYGDIGEAFVEGVFVREQGQVADFELPTDGYSLLNAEVSTRVPYLTDRNVKLFVRGTNLNDAEARVHSSFIKDLAPLRGRAVLCGIRATF
jgi:iron complex outermembrane receptor protein